MSAGKLTISILVCAALSLLPLAVRAEVTFMNISGVARGNAIATFMSMSPDGKTKVNKKVVLSNGVLFPTSGAKALVFDNVNHVARLNTTVKFMDNSDTMGTGIMGGVPVDIYYRGDSLLQLNSNVLSGACLVEVFYPSNNFIASNPSYTGKQFIIEGGAHVIITGKNDPGKDTGSAILKASNFSPYWAYYYDYAGAGDTERIFTMDGKLTVPAAKLRFESYTTAP